MSAAGFVDFSDMDDLGPIVADAPAPAAPEFMLACQKCRGSGSTQWGPCFACKGEGKVSEARLKRVASWRKGEATKAANKVRRPAQWREANPAEGAWIDAAAARGFRFAASMAEAIVNYGSLTERQLETVHRLMAEDAERAAKRAAEKVTREADAPDLGDSAAKILAALNKAAAARLKWPTMRAGEIKFVRAGDDSKNPGCAYVKRGEEYLGKITPDGRFIASRECDAAAQAKVIEVATDPHAAMIAHGKETGTCGCCGRELTDPVSIAKGIGPICEANYF